MESRFNGNLHYLQKNAGKLVIHEVTSSLFSGKSSTASSSPATSLSSTFIHTVLGSFSSSLGTKKDTLPMVFSMIQPLLVSWSIKGIKKLIGRLFSGRKKKKQ
ncbi:hypothetical protein D0T51_00870 [Parabacteroides sp. 52]|nr:hypothetical protein [Parabacteroides sp. 52]